MEELTRVTQENHYYRERLSEMQEFCSEAEKSLSSSRADSILIQKLRRTIDELVNENESLKQELSGLHETNQGLIHQCSTLNDLNSQLSSRKDILEIEVERLNQVVYTKDDQLRQVMTEIDFNHHSSPRASPKQVFNRTSFSYSSVFRDEEQRSQVFEAQKQKMKSLASRGLQSPGKTARTRSPSPSFSHKCKNLYEIRALIRQAQESQKARLRHKQL